MPHDCVRSPRWSLLVPALVALTLAGDAVAPAAETDVEPIGVFLGRVERKKELGLLADAQQLLEARLAGGRRTEAAASHRLVIQARLAEVDFLSGQYSAAIRLAQDCRRELASQAAGEVVDLSGELHLQMTQLLARAYVARNRSNKESPKESDHLRAEALLEEALAEARKMAGPLPLLEVMVLQAELTEQMEAAKADEGRTQARWKSLDGALRRIAGEDAPSAKALRRSASFCRMQARCCAALGNDSEAIRLLESLLSRPEVTGLERRQVLAQMAGVCRLAGRHDEEVAAWARVIQLQESAGEDESGDGASQEARRLNELADCRLRWLDARRAESSAQTSFDPVPDLVACKALYLKAAERLGSTAGSNQDRDACRSQHGRCLRGLFQVLDRSALWNVLPKVASPAERLRCSLDLHEALQRTLPLDAPEQYQVKLSLAAQYLDAGEHRKAGPYLVEAERFYRDYEPLQVVALTRTLNLLAEVDRLEGRLPQAGNRLSEAAALDAEHKLVDTPLSLGITINRGRLAAALGSYNDAQTFFLDAAEHAEAMGPEAADSESLALLHLGLLYKALARCDPSETCCQRALKLQRNSLAAYESESQLLPYYVALGGLAIARSDPADLEGYVQQARRISNAYDLQRTYLGVQVRHQEAALHYLRYRQSRQETEADRARQLWREVLEIAEEKGWSTDLSTGLYYLSRLDFLVWQTRRGEQQSAAAVARKNYMDVREKFLEEAGVYEEDVKRLSKDAEAFNLRATSYGTVLDRADSQNEYNDLAVRRAELDHRKEQLRTRHEDLETKRRAVTLAYGKYADHAGPRTGGLDEVERLAARAVEVLEQAPLYPGLHYVILCHHADVLRTQADMFEKTSQDHEPAVGEDAASGLRRQAIARLQKAIQLMEQPRLSTFGGDVARAEFFARYTTAFDLMLAVLFADDPRANAKRALVFAERRRNRTFLDRVHADGVSLERDASAQDRSLTEREQQLLADWAVLAERLRQRSREMQPVKQHDEPLETLRAQLDQLQQEYETLHEEILARSPMYRRVLGVPLTEEQVEEAVDRWLDCNEPGLYYHVGEKDSYLFLIGIPRGEIEFRRISAAPDEASVSADRIAGWVRDYVGTIRGELESSASTFVDRARFAEPMWLRMTESLVPREVRQRIAELSKNGDCHLNVFPDGKLYQLPLDALLVQPGDHPKFLADTIGPTALCYGPSLMIAQRLKAPRADVKGGEIRAVSLADPDVQNISPLTSPVASRYLGMLKRSALTRLTHSREESDGLSRAWGEEHLTLLLGAQATEANLRAELLQPVTCLHLATHGITAAGKSPETTGRDESARESLNFPGALVLTPPAGEAIDRSNDGFLELDEIYQLHLGGCEIAVLSACNTNIGPAMPLETGAAMSRAFLSAGARRVVSSQWAVEDVSTSRLISHFFSQVADSIRKGDSPDYAMALHGARQALREDETFRDPFYWAPFILTGPAN